MVTVPGCTLQRLSPWPVFAMLAVVIAMCDLHMSFQCARQAPAIVSPVFAMLAVVIAICMAIFAIVVVVTIIFRESRE